MALQRSIFDGLQIGNRSVYFESCNSAGFRVHGQRSIYEYEYNVNVYTCFHRNVEKGLLYATVTNDCTKLFMSY